MLSKIKNKLTAFGLCCLTLCFILSCTNSPGTAHASSNYDELDKLFISTINEVFDYEECEQTLVSAKKTEICDIWLNPLGLQYSFDYAGTSGFALIINDGQPAITEIATDTQAPFYTSELLSVYVSPGVYWEFDGSEYYDCDSGLPIHSESVKELGKKAFRGSGTLYYASGRIDYLYRSEAKYNVLSSIPLYNYGGTNACAAVAGSNIVAYYDKTYTNLIPNYEPGTAFLGIYSFKVANQTTNELADILHNDMGINSLAPGATISQFRSGLSTYINRRGYSASYTSLLTGSNLNYENAKTSVVNGKAIALFTGGFRTVTITTENGYDTLQYEYSDTNHVSAGFGCLEVSYTLPNYSTRTDRYIHCSMGVGLYRNGYINIATTQIDEALVVNIG